MKFHWQQRIYRVYTSIYFYIYITFYIQNIDVDKCFQCSDIFPKNIIVFAINYHIQVVFSKITLFGDEHFKNTKIDRVTKAHEENQVTRDTSDHLGEIPHRSIRKTAMNSTGVDPNSCLECLGTGVAFRTTDQKPSHQWWVVFGWENTTSSRHVSKHLPGGSMWPFYVPVGVKHQQPLISGHEKPSQKRHGPWITWYPSHWQNPWAFRLIGMFVSRVLWFLGMVGWKLVAGAKKLPRESTGVLHPKMISGLIKSGEFQVVG